MPVNEAFHPVPSIALALTEGDDVEVAAQVRCFVQDVLTAYLPQSIRILSIDGMDGVGKSTIGRALASHLGAAFIDVDDFLDTGRDCYFPAIRFQALKNAVSAAGRLVVSGCLMDSVLRRIGEQADFRIYIARTARMRGQEELEFVDERDLLLGGKSATELITEEEESAQRWAQAPEPYGGGDPTVPELAKELIRYHCEVSPHRTADLIIRLARIN